MVFSLVWMAGARCNLIHGHCRQQGENACVIERLGEAVALCMSLLAHSLGVLVVRLLAYLCSN